MLNLYYLSNNSWVQTFHSTPVVACNENTELTVKDKNLSKRKWSQKDHQIPQRPMEYFLCVFFEAKLICRVICQVEVNILSSIMLFSCRRAIQVQLSYTGRAIPDKHHVCPDFCMDVSTM